MSEILLSDVRRLRVAPGDVLVVTAPELFGDDGYEIGHKHILATFSDALPGTTAIVVSEDIDVAVIDGASVPA